MNTDWKAQVPSNTAITDSRETVRIYTLSRVLGNNQDLCFFQPTGLIVVYTTKTTINSQKDPISTELTKDEN